MDGSPPVEFVNMGVAVVTPIDKLISDKLISLITSVLVNYLDEAAKRLAGTNKDIPATIEYPHP